MPQAASPCPSAMGFASGECRSGLAGGRACMAGGLTEWLRHFKAPWMEITPHSEKMSHILRLIHMCIIKHRPAPLIDRKPTIHRGRYLLKRSGVENDGCGFFLHKMNRRWMKVSFESLYMFIFQPVNNFRPNQIFHQVAHRDAIIQFFKDVFHAGPLV